MRLTRYRVIGICDNVEVLKSELASGGRGSAPDPSKELTTTERRSQKKDDNIRVAGRVRDISSKERELITKRDSQKRHKIADDTQIEDVNLGYIFVPESPPGYGFRSPLTTLFCSFIETREP